MRELKAEITERVARGQMRWAIELSEEVVALAEAEGVAAHIGDFYEVPAMLYYGWVVTCEAAGIVLAFAMPKSVTAKLPLALAWIVPLVVVLYTFYYCAHWFTG